MQTQTQTQIQTQTIDIVKIIKESNSKLLKKLPDFVVKMLIKISKIDEINEIITKYSDYQGVDFLPKIIEYLKLNVEIEGLENLPEDGRCIFVANHPFGILDGLILTNIVGNKYGKLQAVGNEYFNIVPNLNPIIANVSVFGENPKKYLLELNEIYKSDMPITHFPYGLVSRIHKFKVQDKDWTKSFIKKSIQNKRNIVPIRFYGRNSNLFYAIFLFRKIFRIKINLEMALLTRELVRKKGKTIKVSIDRPIHHNFFKNKLSHKENAELVRSLVYNLKHK